MCIRDSYENNRLAVACHQVDFARGAAPVVGQDDVALRFQICLLYTSDAADERSSVDLGGRRIIKKKNRTIIVDEGQKCRNTQRDTQKS